MTALLLPVEVIARDLDIRLVLGARLAARGFSSFIGEPSVIHRIGRRLPGGVYVGKGLIGGYFTPDATEFRALKRAGFASLLDVQNNPYSFIFDGQAGALDHAIASASLVPQVVDTMEWHINADEPALLDYNLEHGRDPALFDPDSPYRVSDHDPVVVGLDLTD